MLPLALGLYGAAMQFVREKKTFLMMLVLFGITSFTSDVIAAAPLASASTSVREIAPLLQ